MVLGQRLLLSKELNMAKRPVFVPLESGNLLVKTFFLEFDWHPGFAKSQKQKSIVSLHSKIKKELRYENPLDISSKSLTEEGVEASAFNLIIETVSLNKKFSVECAFQASKVFENGGPYVDLLYKTSIEAKKDPRLKSSGRLTHFHFYNQKWPLEPQTLFYDWIYINALHKNEKLAKSIGFFDSFTDIEFNPERSINCQAYSAALYLALNRRGLIDKALESPENYKNIVIKHEKGKTNKDENKQPDFF